jgi:hypothetical protein
MKVQRISLLAAALTLVAAPTALAGLPHGSHGQETDADTAPALTVPSALPQGSHGQESDAKTVPVFPAPRIEAARRATMTITTVARGRGLRIVDADRSGKPSLGDLEVERQQFVTVAGVKLGRSSEVCVQIDAAGSLYHCQSLNHFAGGDIVTAGSRSSSTRTYTSAIVGGTGIYTGASGIVTGRLLDSKLGRARVVFSIWRS